VGSGSDIRPGTESSRACGGRNWDFGDKTLKNVAQLALAEQASSPDDIADQAQIYTKNDNEVYVRDGSGAEDTLTKGGSAGGKLLVAYKPDDESAANNTLQDDDDLQLSVETATVYRFRFVLWVTCGSATPDLKLSLAGPGTPTKLQATVFATATSAGDAAWKLDGQLTAWASTNVVNYTAAPTAAPVIIEGILFSDAAGTFKLEWAQNTTDGSNAMYVLKGSYLEMVKLG